MTRRRRTVLPASVVCALMLGAGTSGCVHSHTQPPSPATVATTKPDHELGAETGIAVSSTPQGLMHEGAEKLIQERLRHKGLLKAEQCTGQMDADTREALRAFQNNEGLPATGLPSYETVEHLGLKLEVIFRSVAHSTDPPPRPGSAG